MVYFVFLVWFGLVWSRYMDKILHFFLLRSQYRRLYKGITFTCRMVTKFLAFVSFLGFAGS